MEIMFSEGCIDFGIFEEFDPFFSFPGHLLPLLRDNVMDLILLNGVERHELGILDSCI